MVQLDEGSLENLCIAISNCKNSKGLYIALRPKDVLQPWLVEQLPKREYPGFNPFREE